MKKALSLVALAFAAPAVQAQTKFAQGDLAIIGYNASNPDIVSMVSFKGFTAGTSLILTDYGWLSTTNTFRFGGEGYIQATATRDFAPGEVFSITSNGAAASAPYVTGDGFTYAYDETTAGGAPQFAPSGSGDGAFVFQGTIDDAAGTYTGTLLYGVNADNTGSPSNGWQTNATNSNTSALPSSLTEGRTAIGLSRFDGEADWKVEYDNYEYVGTRTGTQEALLAAIGSRANWRGTNTLLTLDGTAFSVQAVPEPGAVAALGLGAFAVLRRRRK